MAAEPRLRLRRVAGAGALASALLFANTASWRGADLESLRTPRRYWEDLVVASTAVHAPAGPHRVESIGAPEGTERRRAYERFVSREARDAGLGPWQFWRTLPLRPALLTPRYLSRSTDDPGRALLSTWAFRLLGGVAPLLPLWLGALVCAPILFWLAWELDDAGYPVAAFAVPLGAATSCYVVELLSLPYSGVGFYVVALLALGALGVHAVLGRSRLGGLAFRCAAAGVLFWICGLCRSATLFLAPGFILAVLAGAWLRTAAQTRTAARRWLAVSLAFAAGLGAFAVPSLLGIRGDEHHEVWLAVWEGLGDFDRDRGHAWHDPTAKSYLRRHGRVAPREQAVWARDNEDFWREHFLRDVRSDPAWYGTILAKRLVATVTQARLWTPWLRATEPSEDIIQSYYNMAARFGWHGVGVWRAPIPVPVFLAATGGLLGLVLARKLPARPVWVLACLAVGALGLPVAFTTASALEMQAFGLVYLFGAGLLLDGAWRLGTRGQRPGPHEPGRSSGLSGS